MEREATTSLGGTMRYWGIVAAAAALLLGNGFCKGLQAEGATPVQPEVWTPDIPDALVGPYISDPATLMALDRPGTGTSCDGAGPLNFQCLVYRDDRSTMSLPDLENNPFMLPVFKQVRRTIASDLNAQTASHLSTKFLEFAGAKIELVGVVNRMDRQFNTDIVPEHGAALACGEISAIYRFAYKGTLNQGPLDDRIYQSRLPITLNVVFPAQPWSGSPDCKTVAGLWRDYVQAIKSGSKPGSLSDHAEKLVASLHPSDIDRIELNMQSSRVPASSDSSNFGTRATYIIRVFRWTKDKNTPKGYWAVSYLTNQIDRARLLGEPMGDENTCPDKKGKALSRKALVEYLLGTKGIGDVDLGLVNIPIDFLACRAVSVSPGGASRSANQPFWNDTKNPIITDAEIQAALSHFKADHPDSLSFIGNSEEFRIRLNEATCSGCHQSRAIAGFHFPGADRPGTASVNAIFLPGSAHFFGDQPRRNEIINALASLSDTKTKLDRRLLASSYAARPQNSYRELRPTEPDKIQLVAGWGSACLIYKKQDGRRQWGCEDDLTCQPVFSSINQPRIGMCLGPRNPPRIGEAMQFGSVKSKGFDGDEYIRDKPLNSTANDTTISIKGLPAPVSNSYIASHQEYFHGIGTVDRRDGETDEQHARRVLEQRTGGFPGGALRLGQCKNLPGEATCGLLASSGFTDCIGEVGAGFRTAESCFRLYTNYSGVRACDPANPCRDDYICMSPMGYTSLNAKTLYEKRRAAREAERKSYPETSDRWKVLGLKYFGEEMPDDKWLTRNDHRGVCIPPYFVFQFKADGHVVPPNP